MEKKFEKSTFGGRLRVCMAGHQYAQRQRSYGNGYDGNVQHEPDVFCSGGLCLRIHCG